MPMRRDALSRYNEANEQPSDHDVIKRLEPSDFRASHDEWPEETRSILGRQRYLFASRQTCVC